MRRSVVLTEKEYAWILQQMRQFVSTQEVDDDPEQVENTNSILKKLEDLNGFR